MTDVTATDWCYATEYPISGDILRRSQALQRDFEWRAIRPKPKAQNDNIILMPEDDLAVLGKRRVYGCAYVCGKFVELSSMVSSEVSGMGSPKASVRGKRKDNKKDESKQRDPVARSAYRAAKNVRRLVNVNEFRFMWTLTLAPPSTANAEKWNCIPLTEQRDYHRVRDLWKLFLKRWRRKGMETFPWLAVFELHDSTKTSNEKRGTWHIHFCTSARLLWSDISTLWSFGVVRFDDFTKPKKGVRRNPVANPGAYMSKYVGKNFDSNNYKQKRYSCSRDVKRPVKLGLVEALKKYPIRNMYLCYNNIRRYEAYGVEYLGGSATFKSNKRLIP